MGMMEIYANTGSGRVVEKGVGHPRYYPRGTCSRWRVMPKAWTPCKFALKGTDSAVLFLVEVHASNLLNRAGAMKIIP